MGWLWESLAVLTNNVLFARDRLAHERAPDSLAFDEAHGVETARWTLGGYEPCPPALVDRVLDTSPVPLEGRVFVDLGCGKGRVLIIAARRPFERVIGVEVDAALHRTCARNLAIEDPARQCPTEAVWQDAAELAFPPRDLVLFLYNPFEQDVLALLADRLAVHPGQVAVAYVHPVCAAVLDDRGWAVAHEEGEAHLRYRWYLPPDEGGP